MTNTRIYWLVCQSLHYIKFVTEKVTPSISADGGWRGINYRSVLNKQLPEADRFTVTLAVQCDVLSKYLVENFVLMMRLRIRLLDKEIPVRSKA